MVTILTLYYHSNHYNIQLGYYYKLLLYYKIRTVSVYVHYHIILYYTKLLFCISNPLLVSDNP